MIMKISKYLFATAVLALTLSSCSSDGYWDQYDQPEPRYSFEQTALNVATVKSTNTFTVKAVRNVKNGDVSLPVTLSDVYDVTFDAKNPDVLHNITLSSSSFDFKNGENVATIDVTINCDGGHQYQAQLAFPADDKSVAGSNKCTMTFTTEHNWVSIGTGIFIDAFVTGDFENECEFLQAEGFQRWRVMHPYDQGMEADAGEWEDWRTGNYPEFFEFWEEGENLTWAPVSLGLNYQATSGQPMYSYPPAAMDKSMKNCKWYMPGYACLSPYYFVPALNGGWDWSGNFGAVQIIFPSLLASE